MSCAATVSIFSLFVPFSLLWICFCLTFSLTNSVCFCLSFFSSPNCFHDAVPTSHLQWKGCDLTDLQNPYFRQFFLSSPSATLPQRNFCPHYWLVWWSSHSHPRDSCPAYPGQENRLGCQGVGVTSELLWTCTRHQLFPAGMIPSFVDSKTAVILAYKQLEEYRESRGLWFQRVEKFQAPTPGGGKKWKKMALHSGINEGSW